MPWQRGWGSVCGQCTLNYYSGRGSAWACSNQANNPWPATQAPTALGPWIGPANPQQAAQVLVAKRSPAFRRTLRLLCWPAAQVRPTARGLATEASVRSQTFGRPDVLMTLLETKLRLGARDAGG